MNVIEEAYNNFNRWICYNICKSMQCKYLNKCYNSKHTISELMKGNICKNFIKKEKNMELRDTVEMMNSADYKERFKAEYHQLRIRYEKLGAMLDKWDNGKLDFTPTCPREIYNKQIEGMEIYLDTLADRAEIEGIEL